MSEQAPQTQPTPLPARSDGPRPAFEPARHLSRVSGADYLEVKWRLVWLRDRHPDAEVETVLVKHEGDWALFKAVVRLPTGGMATGYGQEDAQGFKDYMEKAETKALGRALAALGFGTQFCADHEFGAAQGRIVDAPVRDSRGQGYEPRHGGQAPEQPATQRQIVYLQAVAREAGISPQALDDRIYAEFQIQGGPSGLSRRDASTLIQMLQDEPR